MEYRSLSPALRGSAFYFAFFGALGAWLPFINVYFHQLGLSGWQIGLLSALIPAATFLLAGPIAAIADRRGRHVRVLTLAILGLGAGLLVFVGFRSFPVLLLLMALLAICFSPLTALADSSIAGMAIRHGLNYGGMRLWGSLSYALISIASGGLWQHLGYRTMFVVSAALYLTVAWFTRGLEGVTVVEAHDRVPVTQILRDRFFLILMIATFAVSMAMGMDIAFSGIYMTHLGGSGLLVGMLAGVSALCELPTMRYSDRIIRLVGGPGSLVIAYGLFGVAYLGYTLATVPLVMLGFSLFRGFAFGLYYAGTVRLISRRAPAGRAGTMQGVLNALSFGLAQLLSRVLGGGIYDALGPSTVFVFCTVAAAGAVVIMGGAIGLGLMRAPSAIGATSADG